MQLPYTQPSSSLRTKCRKPTQALSNRSSGRLAFTSGRQQHPIQQESACCRLHVITRASWDPDSQGGQDFPGGANDPYFKLMNSKVFRNDNVLQEFNTMVESLMGLSKMSSKYPDFDPAGKRMYIEQMRAASERYEVFLKRLELSDDPAAKEYLRMTNAQMMNGGFNLHSMFAGLKLSLKQYEEAVEAEEQAIAAGPAAHQEFLKGFRQAWRQTALGAMDTAKLSESIPPHLLMKAQQDPQFWVAIREISDSPTPDVINKWMTHETIGPLVTEMARNMLQKKMDTQF